MLDRVCSSLFFCPQVGNYAAKKSLLVDQNYMLLKYMTEPIIILNNL